MPILPGGTFCGNTIAFETLSVFFCKLNESEALLTITREGFEESVYFDKIEVSVFENSISFKDDLEKDESFCTLSFDTDFKVSGLGCDTPESWDEACKKKNVKSNIKIRLRKIYDPAKIFQPCCIIKTS